MSVKSYTDSEIFVGTPEIEAPELQHMSTHGNSVTAANRSSANLALRILDTTQSYGNKVCSSEGSWPGKLILIPLIETGVSKLKPMQMILPASSFLSPNRRDSTLGSLPDLGEELALMHLNGLCESIAEVYEQGANVVIASDGLVYNGESASTFWQVEYLLTITRLDRHRRQRSLGLSHSNLKIIETKELRHLRALRIFDLLGFSETEHLNREEHLIHTSRYRREPLAKFAPVGFNPQEAVRNDQDTCVTHRGYIKFMTNDLMYSQLSNEKNFQQSPKKRYKDAIEKVAL